MHDKYTSLSLDRQACEEGPALIGIRGGMLLRRKEDRHETYRGDL